MLRERKIWNPINIETQSPSCDQYTNYNKRRRAATVIKQTK